MLVEVLQVIAGLALVLIPGFLLSLVIFPSPQIDPWKRAGLSLGFGVMAIFYLGAILAHPRWRLLELGPILLAVVVFCAICSGLAYLRGGLSVPAAYVRRMLGVLPKPRPRPPKPPQPTIQQPAQPEPIPPQPPKPQEPKPEEKAPEGEKDEVQAGNSGSS